MARSGGDGHLLLIQYTVLYCIPKPCYHMFLDSTVVSIVTVDYHKGSHRAALDAFCVVLPTQLITIIYIAFSFFNIAPNANIARTLSKARVIIGVLRSPGRTVLSGRRSKTTGRLGPSMRDETKAFLYYTVFSRR